MNLSTTYMGMTLRTPLVPSASPLSESIDDIKRMEDAGAAAVVLYSLFEEQLAPRANGPFQASELNEGYVEVAGLFPRRSQYRLSPDEYLDHIRKSKEAVDIPVIASLNCTSIGGWTSYARQIQEAGADALELNIYSIPTDLHLEASQVEREYIEIVEEVRSAVTLPLAVKLSPFFSNIANVAWRVEKAGANALVLFNRFYQPDIDPEAHKVVPHILLSSPHSMRLPLRWIALLYGRIHTDLAATGGIHTERDVAKMLLAGASITMLCSVLLRRGIAHIADLERELGTWMELHRYESVGQMQGAMCQQQYADPSAFERAHYIRSLSSYRQMDTR